MALNAAQFDRHLATGELKPAYLLAGEEHLLLLEAADALRAKAKAAGYVERVVLESGESGFEWYELANAGAALSLFATRRVIDLRVPTGKPGKEGAEAIAKYCESPPPDTILLVTSTTWSKQHDAAWSAAIEDIGIAVTFWPLKGNELPAWLAARAGKRGLELTSEAVELLAERMEGNLLAAAQEIDKLALLAGSAGTRRVDAETLEQLVSDSARFDVFQLVDATLAGDSARALRIAAALRAEGEAVPALLGWFTMQLNIALRLAVAVEQGASIDVALRNERVWPQARLGIFRAALGRARANYWEAMLAQAAHVERVGKGRGGAGSDAWRELERLLAMVAQPRAAKSLAVRR